MGPENWTGANNGKLGHIAGAPACKHAVGLETRAESPGTKPGRTSGSGCPDRCCNRGPCETRHGIRSRRTCAGRTAGTRIRCFSKMFTAVVWSWDPERARCPTEPPTPAPRRCVDSGSCPEPEDPWCPFGFRCKLNCTKVLRTLLSAGTPVFSTHLYQPKDGADPVSGRGSPRPCWVVTALSGSVQKPGHETETWPANTPRRGRTGQYRATPCLNFRSYHAFPSRCETAKASSSSSATLRAIRSRAWASR